MVKVEVNMLHFLPDGDVSETELEAAIIPD